MADREARISVVIPTHNRAELLPRAIASVLDQTYQRFELIVVDDGSTDATAEVVAAFEDPRLRYVRRQEAGGAPVARNLGVASARTDLIAFLDDDDRLEPEFLERTVAIFEAAPAELGFSWSGARWVRPNSRGEEEVLRQGAWQPTFANREEAFRSFLRNRHVGTACGVCFRRECLEAVGGFDERLVGGAEDTDFFIRAVREFDFAVIPEILVTIDLHGGAHLRHHSLAKAEDYEIILAKHREALQRDPGTLKQLLYKTAWLFYAAGDKRRGRTFLRKCLALAPLQPKAWVAGLLYETLGRHGAAVHRRLSDARRA